MSTDMRRPPEPPIDADLDLLEEMGQVVSASECTGLMPAMPADADGEIFLAELGALRPSPPASPSQP